MAETETYTICLHNAYLAARMAGGSVEMVALGERDSGPAFCKPGKVYLAQVTMLGFGKKVKITPALPDRTGAYEKFQITLPKGTYQAYMEKNK